MAVILRKFVPGDVVRFADDTPLAGQLGTIVQQPDIVSFSKAIQITAALVETGDPCVILWATPAQMKGF